MKLYNQRQLLKDIESYHLDDNQLCLYLDCDKTWLRSLRRNLREGKAYPAQVEQAMKALEMLQSEKNPLYCKAEAGEEAVCNCPECQSEAQYWFNEYTRSSKPKTDRLAETLKEEPDDTFLGSSERNDETGWSMEYSFRRKDLTEYTILMDKNGGTKYE